MPPTEVGGRKGIYIESDLHRDLTFFKEAGERFAQYREHGLRYGEILQEYPRSRELLSDDEPPARFLPFAGTEGYNPVTYAPYILAVAVGKLLRLDFPSLLLFARLAGLLTFTAAAAYAIKITPKLKWAFVLIAMLPVSLYNRSVLSADGAALASALVITALCFKAVDCKGRLWERSLWMTLCALCKQPQIAFVLLELMTSRMKQRRRTWANLMIVAAPSFILSPLWVWAVSADIAAWRLLEAETYPREQFDPLWKLGFMYEHPLHFPWAAWNAITIWGDPLWQELIGILGWQDIWLQTWVYVALTAAVVLISLEKLELARSARARVAIITGIGVLSYVVLVYLIFFITYTPVDIDHVRGVQGRYFVIALPMAALFVAAIANVNAPRSLLAALGISGSLLSGTTCAAALLFAHWFAA